MGILYNSSSLALWHDIVLEAEKVCDIALEEELESYLVFLMIRYTGAPEVAKKIIATDFLEGVQLQNNMRALALQNVGDKCLIVSGLFPRVAVKRLVKISYFVHLGQSSYATISKNHDDIYSLLSKQFVTLMDILQSIKHNSQLLPLEAYELWNETGSKRAYSILKEYSIHNKSSKQ